MGRRVKRRKLLRNLSIENQMYLDGIEKLAIQLINQHNVTHYKFKWGNARRSVGLCTGDSIILSQSYALSRSIEEIRNTILHEIAHAIVGVRKGHKEEWQRTAKELGVNWKIKYHKY